MTLKSRIFVIFILSSVVTLLGISVISYYTIYSILNNKIQKGNQSNLKQVEVALTNTIDNLNHISQQLAYSGILGKELFASLQKQEPFERQEIVNGLKKELNLISFSNPDIGLIMYYFDNDDTYQFENYPVKDHFNPHALPLLGQYYDISYFGPHMSYNRLSDQLALSVLRKVDMPMRDDVYIYIESNLDLALSGDVLNSEKADHSNARLILDNNGRVAYSEAPDLFAVDSDASALMSEKSFGSYRGYHWFKQTSAQGWSVASVIPDREYNREKNRWLIQVLLVSLLFLGLTLLLAWLLWKMVYRPLNRFHTEIKHLSQNEIKPQELEPIRIPEFQVLLTTFRQMKEQIWELFEEVEKKEKLRTDLEVEKLLHQINPHFLMNTLDTIHWLAVMNDQEEIDKLVLSLNKLLYYNLGKLGENSTIYEEIDALKQYLQLQQVRYDFQFDVRLDVDEAVMNRNVPRFILQPIVENALYHGLRDDGHIVVEVKNSMTTRSKL